MKTRRSDPDLGTPGVDSQKPLFYSPKALAALIVVGPNNKTMSVRTVRDWCANNKIPGAYQIGRLWLIPAPSVELLLNGPLPDNVSVFRK